MIYIIFKIYSINNMNELIEKISDYHIFNYIIPGASFIALLPLLPSWNQFPIDNLFLQVCLCYTIGLIISRIGSFIFDIKVITTKRQKGKQEFAPYDKFIDAARQDPKINTLNTIANMYRSFAVLWLIYAFIHLTYSLLGIGHQLRFCFVFWLLSVLFICSYKKQKMFIIKRIQKQYPKRGEI